MEKGTEYFLFFYHRLSFYLCVIEMDGSESNE